MSSSCSSHNAMSCFSTKPASEQTQHDVLYMPLSETEKFESVPDFDFRSIHDYAPYNDIDRPYKDMKVPENQKWSRKGKYDHFFVSAADHSHVRADDDAVGNLTRSVLESALIAMCYVLVFITMPFSLIFSLKFIESFEKLVVFRLGRLQHTKGPGGTVLIIPCVDHVQRVDTRAKAFNIPPTQSVTHDNGVVEVGGTVYYHIKDAVASVVSVKDWNYSIRQLALTSLHRLINKQRFNEVQAKRPKLADDLKEELNKFTASWGMEVTEIQLSDVRVLKDGESHAATVLKTLMQPNVRSQIFNQLALSMGNKDGFKDIDPAALETMFDQAFTAPKGMVDGIVKTAMQPELEVVKEDKEPTPAPVEDDGYVPAEVSIDMGEPEEGDEQPGCSHEPETREVELDLDRMLTTIRSVLSVELVNEVGALYQMHCTGLGEFYVDLKHGAGAAAAGVLTETNAPDVTFTITATDLLSLLIGQLNPLDAYLSGKMIVKGDTKKAMRLQTLGEHIRAKYSTQANK